jgi:hypothetical protein
MGTGSTSGSIFQSGIKHLLEILSTERTPLELCPRDKTLVSAKQMVSSPGNTFCLFIFTGFLMDRWSHLQNKK